MSMYVELVIMIYGRSTLDLGAVFSAFVAPICKSGHDNTNMAPIGFILVSLAANISVLATTKRSRSISDCVFRKRLRRQI